MAYTPQIEFYKKRQFGDKLNMTFVFLRENAWPYLRAQLLISGPILLISNIMMSQFSLSFLNLDGGVTPDFVISMMGMYGVMLISVVVTSAVMPAVAYSYMRVYQGKAPSEIRIPDVTRNLLSKVFNLLVFNIIAAIVVVVGMFFFFIPGVYLMIVLSLGSAIIVFEDNNPIDAFGRSFKLIKDKWWSTSVQKSGDLSGLDESNFGSNPLGILFSVFETFGAILTYSISFLALAFQYFNLVERRESRGLMSRIEQMDDAGNVEDEETY